MIIGPTAKFLNQVVKALLVENPCCFLVTPNWI